jgi:hypothetical protein
MRTENINHDFRDGVLAGDHEDVCYHGHRPARVFRSAKDDKEGTMTRDEGIHWIQPRLIDCEGFDCFDEEARR